MVLGHRPDLKPGVQGDRMIATKILATKPSISEHFCTR